MTYPTPWPPLTPNFLALYTTALEVESMVVPLQLGQKAADKDCISTFAWKHETTTYCKNVRTGRADRYRSEFKLRYRWQESIDVGVRRMGEVEKCEGVWWTGRDHCDSISFGSSDMAWLWLTDAVIYRECLLLSSPLVLLFPWMSRLKWLWLLCLCNRDMKWERENMWEDRYYSIYFKDIWEILAVLSCHCV